MELYSNISKTLSKKNINLAVGTIYDYMRIWKEWYSGDVADFHHYTARLANGQTTELERLTMNMPKKVCEDMAKLLWTEKTQIKLSNKNATKRLWSILDNKYNNFTTNFPNFIEQVLALGSGALIEYKENGNTIIDYVTGDVVIPYKYTNSYIYGLITISRYSEIEDVESEKEKLIYFTHITYHEYENGIYKKKNELYKSENEQELGEEVSFQEHFPGVKKEDSVETDTPYFQVMGPNLANNLDMSSPLSLSIFANSIDRFKSIDVKYDSFMQEFVLGRKRILVDNSTLKAKAIPNENGKVDYVQYFDANDQVYVAVEGMEKQPAKEIDFKLRASEHIDAINAELNWLSSNVGLGSNFYKFDGSAVYKNEEEVMSENSEAFRTRTHHLINVNDVVYDLVSAICHIEGIKTNDIIITPDDSIIENKNAKKTMALMEVQQGLKSKKSYLMEFEGLSEEQAEEELEKINEEKMSNQELFGFPAEEKPTENKEKEDKKKEEKKEE